MAGSTMVCHAGYDEQGQDQMESVLVSKESLLGITGTLSAGLIGSTNPEGALTLDHFGITDRCSSDMNYMN